jgi:hypothetical protein
VQNFINYFRCGAGHVREVGPYDIRPSASVFWRIPCMTGNRAAKVRELIRCRIGDNEWVEAEAATSNVWLRYLRHSLK